MPNGPARFWYAIRVTIPDDWTLEDLVRYVDDEFLDRYTPCFLATFEIGKISETPHIHIYCRSQYDSNPFRLHWRRCLPRLCGNSGLYSIKTGGPTEDDRLRELRYICKGNGADKPPLVVLQEGFTTTDEDVARYHREFYENAPNVGVKTGKDRCGASVVDQVLDRCKKREPPLEWNACDAIVREYLGLCREKRRRVSKFEATSVVLGVRNCLCADDSFENAFIGRYSEDLIFE